MSICSFSGPCTGDAKTKDAILRQDMIVQSWNEKAETEDALTVALKDQFQRSLELSFIDKYSLPCDKILEVGVGSGSNLQLLTSKSSNVMGFDASEKMLRHAKTSPFSKSCILFEDQLPDPKSNFLDCFFDMILTCRVVINLEDVASQKKAVEWMLSKLAPGGRLLLLEGSAEGPEALNSIRAEIKLKPLAIPPFNLNVRKELILEAVGNKAVLLAHEGIGLYDYLTRVFYPMQVGEENVKYNTDFHAEAAKATAASPQVNADLFRCSRMHFFAFEKPL